MFLNVLKYSKLTFGVLILRDPTTECKRFLLKTFSDKIY